MLSLLASLRIHRLDELESSMSGEQNGELLATACTLKRNGAFQWQFNEYLKHFELKLASSGIGYLRLKTR